MALLQASLCLLLSCSFGAYGAIDNRPIIGVVLGSESATQAQFWLAADTQAFLEQSGAGVVPVFLNQSDGYYNNLMSRLNGIVIPGGDAELLNSPFGQISYKIFQMAKKMNDQGHYFPILGICLGTQEMSTWPFNPRKNPMSNTTGTWELSLPLNFTKAASTSRFYRKIPANIRNILAKENVTPNFHAYALLLETYYNSTELSSFYSVTSVNTDTNGLVYVSSMEAYKYPFYGIQWHPEKISYWFTPNTRLNHSYDAVIVGQYVSNFFVNEARKSKQSFKTRDELYRFLINNYPTHYEKSTNTVAYYFNDSQAPHFDPNV